MNTAFASYQNAPKAPSRINYDQHGLPDKWGYGMFENAQTLKLFKLLVLDEEDIPSNIRDFSEVERLFSVMRSQKKDAVDIVSDYLKCFWEYVIDTVGFRQGSRNGDIPKLKVVITVPASWPLYTRNRMRLAIENAGIMDERKGGKPTLVFMTEPEAAAIATMKDISSSFGYRSISMNVRQPDLPLSLGHLAHWVQKGDGILICDAGGATVVSGTMLYHRYRLCTA